MAEDDPVEIAQISFYLAKPKQTFATVLSVDKDVHLRKASRQHDFGVEGAQCRFHYFETASKRSNPPWLDFVNDKLPFEGRIVFGALNESPNGILLINVDDCVFAATGGVPRLT